MSETRGTNGVRCMWMRGGTSKGAFFLADDVPSERAELDRFLLRVMGSPDPRQIDGMGGSNPLTSKVAIVGPTTRRDADVAYRFYQVYVDQALVSDAQNCGNMLAGVGPFAIERGLVSPSEDVTSIAIEMLNSDQLAVAKVQTPLGAVTYDGDARIDGVPGTAAPVQLEFRETRGSMCGALLPTGNVADEIDGVHCTLIDNGMPTIVLLASDIGITGYESVEDLEANGNLKQRLETIRLEAGPLMNLGDVVEKSVPKIALVAPPANGGAITVRSFIPHNVHSGIGVLAAASVATSAMLEGSPAHSVANLPEGRAKSISVEHPTGELTCIITTDEAGNVEKTSVLRTARKLMDGEVFV